MRQNWSQIILIGGSGQNVGKTYWSELLVKTIAKTNPINTLKISSHKHPTTAGLKTVNKGNGWTLYEESDLSGAKDSQRLLKAGATKSYYANVEKEVLQQFINELDKNIDINRLLLVESTAFGIFITPKLAYFVSEKDDKICPWTFEYIELVSEESKIINLPKEVVIDNYRWKIEV